MSSGDPSAPTVLFVVSEDWYFVSHRLPQARAVRALGCRVVVAARMRDHEEAIRQEGFEPVGIPMVRGNLNPFREFAAVRALRGVIRAHQPAVVHCVALKPILAGGLAALGFRQLTVVNAFAGMGAILGHGMRRRRLRHRILALSIAVLSRANRARAIVQNADDRRFLVRGRVTPRSRVALIPGSGVDTNAFTPAPVPEGPVTIMMVSRLLRAKGVGELVEAARHLHSRGLDARLWIVGDRDPENPGSVRPDEIAGWQRDERVTFLGQRSDIAALWAQVHIAALPSYYGEGVPKSLLEAAACGRPIVTTDMPGCRDLVPDGSTGVLVPPRDAAALAHALDRLARSPSRRERMGQAARAYVVKHFDEARVAAATTSFYAEILDLPPAPHSLARARW
jgi:glycosyltransferase involved in cell wall biosynthesis